MSRPIREVRAMALKRANAFRVDLYDWLLDARNVAVWRMFEGEANRLWIGGRKHYSARTIGEWIRHNTLAADASIDFKVTDWMWPDMARLYMLLYPNRAGFFETRGRRAA